MSNFYLENISKSYKTYNGNFFALKDINLEFPSTGLVSIVGKSGSGKSTLLNILLGIEKSSSGILKFNGKRINKMSDRHFSKYHLNDVTMVFQHYNVFLELTALENVALPLLMNGYSRVKAKKEAINLLEKFSLSHLSNQKTKLLSGGEKQRIAILRAIITNPKVILCDEPTGALDTQNSEIIMQILAKLSKSTLIIMVSHNRNLVERYSDRIITLKDGKIVDDDLINNTFERNNKKNSYCYSNRWMNLFTKLNLKTNFKKNIFSIISCVFGFAAIYISAGFYQGSQASQDNALKNNLSVLHASASTKTFFDIEDSPLSYEKSVRPSFDELYLNFLDFNDLTYETNLSFLFPSYPYGNYLGQSVENFQLVPIYDITLEDYGKRLIVEGSPPNGNLLDVIVNEEFVNLLNLNNDDIIDELFNINYFTNISYATGDYENPFINDNYSFNFNLRISAVVREFSFLNTPKIYYSYPALKEELKSTYAENVSEYIGRPISFLEFIEESNEDDPVSSYSSEIFLTSIEESEKFFSFISELNNKESNFRIESTAYDIQQSYKNFISSFSTALFVFVIIAFLGVNFILGMISLSTYIENRKNTAILTCLGARHSSIQSIYLSENYLIISLSIFISILVAKLLEILLNGYIDKKFALTNLIAIPFKSFLNIPFGLVILLLTIAIIFSTIFTLTPMFIYRHISLSDELRDE